MNTPALRLHHNPFSASARRVVMLVHHLKLDVELVLIKNLRDPEERKGLVALNPNAKIPVLEHGDFVLWESNAIMQYLADQAPGQSVYPSELRARADVNRWLFWGAQHFAPAFGPVVWERWMKRMFGAGDPDPREIARGEQQIAQFARVLDDHLLGREWVSGPGLTLADFSLSTALMRCKEAEISLEPYPNVRAWFERVQALDAWRRTQP